MIFYNFSLSCDGFTKTAIILEYAIYPLSLFVFAKNASNTFSDRVFKHPPYVAI